MSEHVLVWRPKARNGGGDDDSQLRLIDMPQGLRRSPSQVRAADAMSMATRAVLLEALAALKAQAAAPGEPLRVSLKSLSAGDLDVLFDVLGEGEVRAAVGGEALWRIEETVLPGLWRIAVRTADGEEVQWLEAAAMASPVLQAAQRLPQASIAVPRQLPAGTMNAPALIAELVTRSREWRPGAGPNHVVNFTLLPLSEPDAEVLTATLGQIPLSIRSSGYGSCQVFGTGLRHVWAVQYMNSMGKIILDTLEVGDIPASACAAREDFEDSAGRLAEILEAYAT